LTNDRFSNNLFCQGIVKIGDFLSNTGKFLQSSKVLTANLSPTQYFKLIGVVDAIPIARRLIIKQSQTNQHFYSSFLGDRVYTELDETEIHLSKVTSKVLYNKFKTKNQTLLPAQNKMKNKYPQLALDRKKIYSLPFTVTVETKIREFQCKILNDIVYTNDKLFHFKMIESPLCTFCQKEDESLKHLLLHCNITKNFWLAFSSWISKQNISMETLTLINILFGVLNDNGDFAILNHLILIPKYFIYKCKLNKTKPILRVFFEKIKLVYHIERKIAKRNDRLHKHYKKWEKITPLLN